MAIKPVFFGLVLQWNVNYCVTLQWPEFGHIRVPYWDCRSSETWTTASICTDSNPFSVQLCNRFRTLGCRLGASSYFLSVVIGWDPKLLWTAGPWLGVLLPGPITITHGNCSATVRVLAWASTRTWRMSLDCRKKTWVTAATAALIPVSGMLMHGPTAVLDCFKG